MAQASSIRALDPAIRAAVDEAVRDGRHTIMEIVDMVKEMGGEVSKSAVGRYAKSARDRMEQYTQAREVAKTWVGQFSTDPEGDVGRLLNEMLRVVAFNTISTIDGEASTKDIMFLASAIKSMADTDRVTQDRILRAQKDAIDKAVKELDKAVKRGLSQESIALAREKIMGIA